MNIIYIADNRDRHNFGCRGTSAALSSIISKEHKIVARISGRLTLNSDFVYIPFVPNITNKIIYSNKYIVKLCRKIVKALPVKIRAKFDFLSLNFDKSMKRLIEYSKINTLYQEINLDGYDYDAIIINGEGSMIMSTPPRRDTLYYMLFIYWANKRGKKVFLLNGMFSDCPKTGSNRTLITKCNEILPLCNFISIRDPISYEYVKKNMNIDNYKYIPDALFTWEKYIDSCPKICNTRYLMPFGFETDDSLEGSNLLNNGHICISGSSAAAWNQIEAKEAYLKLVKEIRKITDCTIILLAVCDGDAFLKEVSKETGTVYIPPEIPIMLGLSILSQSKAYISGRYHPSIMASLGGVPCIFMGSNSHKNIGLQKMLEYDEIDEFSACPTERDIIGICNRLVKLLSENMGREKIKSAARKRASEATILIKYLI